MNENIYPPISQPPAEPKKSNTLLIVIVALVVLCCCCLGLIGSAWAFGDQIVQTLGM